MQTQAQDIQNVKALRHGEHCYIGWSEGGGGEVYCINDYYFLFSIPQYGGIPIFEACYPDSKPEDVVYAARSWT